MLHQRSSHKIILLFLNSIVLLMSGVSVYLFSSKIPLLPWYSPLSTYVLLYLLILLVVQILVGIVIWFIWEKYNLLKSTGWVCLIHTIVLLSMCFIIIYSVELFNIMTILYTFLELLIFSYMLYIIKIS